ncbi:unnamed protein product [Paramecium octaurelia]|uniref:Uncharacterized protein n=1 Tax=Paramecium octaurelia TaxID=43137 RepID=A0A8S1X2X2_PAROT|nr:unnamed protein product [Paramecium octaurelia]
MIGFNYCSNQSYSYLDLDVLCRIIEYDPIENMQIYQEEKSIKYIIDRTKYVRLSDLIFSIKAKFIRFHLGQLLMLFTAMLKKTIEMEDLEIEHLYLDENRIWLELKNNSPQLSILYVKFQYSLRFTGYQCIIYEDDLDEKMKASTKLLQIISGILQDFKTEKITCNKQDSYFSKIVDEIYDPIIQSCQNQNITDTLNSINGILSNHQYDQDSQTINYDDNLIDHYLYQLRDYRLEGIKKEFMESINKYETNQLILEASLMQKVEQIGKNVDELFSYNPKAEESKKIDLICVVQDKREKVLKNLLDSLFIHYFQEMGKDYKFSISQEEEYQMKQNIMKNIQNHHLQQYFENSIYFYFKPDQIQLEQNYQLLLQNLIKSFIKDEIELYIQLQILKLIEDLI